MCAGGRAGGRARARTRACALVCVYDVCGSGYWRKFARVPCARDKGGTVVSEGKRVEGKEAEQRQQSPVHNDSDVNRSRSTVGGRLFTETFHGGDLNRKGRSLALHLPSRTRRRPRPALSPFVLHG